MSIPYSLFNNKMDPSNLFWAAKVQNIATLGLNGLADEIVAMGSTVTKADVLAVLENACQAIEANLLKGYRVSVGGVVDVYTSIRGKFTDGGDNFDPARHEFEVCANAGTRIRKAVRANASAEKVIPVPRAPYLINYADMGSSTTNEKATPGSIGTITGNLLSYHPSNPLEGVYFVNSGGTATKATGVERNKPSELVFLVPTLADGDYTLQVRTVLTKDGQIRTGQLPATLNVGPEP